MLNQPDLLPQSAAFIEPLTAHLRPAFHRVDKKKKKNKTQKTQQIFVTSKLGLRDSSFSAALNHTATRQQQMFKQSSDR